VDVALAFVLAMCSFVIMGLAQGKITRHAEDFSYRVYRVLLHGIFATGLVFILFGDRIVWHQCVTGLTWRAWLALYCLPAWFTALRMGESTAHPEPDRH
jgi:hypothetical protein